MTDLFLPFDSIVKWIVSSSSCYPFHWISVWVTNFLFIDVFIGKRRKHTSASYPSFIRLILSIPCIPRSCIACIRWNRNNCGKHCHVLYRWESDIEFSGSSLVICPFPLIPFVVNVKGRLDLETGSYERSLRQAFFFFFSIHVIQSMDSLSMMTRLIKSVFFPLEFSCPKEKLH